jgi:hypothetical protein
MMRPQQAMATVPRPTCGVAAGKRCPVGRIHTARRRSGTIDSALVKTKGDKDADRQAVA